MELDIRVAHAVVPSECVRPTERLLVCTEVTPYFLFPGVMDRVFVPRKVVGSREDSVAWLAGTRVDAVAPMRAGLAIEKTRRHARADTIASPGATETVSLSVSFPLVLLQQCWSVEA